MPFLLHVMADLVFPPTRQFRSADLPFSTYVSEGSSIKYGAPVEANAPKIKTNNQYCKEHRVDNGVYYRRRI